MYYECPCRKCKNDLVAYLKTKNGAIRKDCRRFCEYYQKWLEDMEIEDVAQPSPEKSYNCPDCDITGIEDPCVACPRVISKVKSPIPDTSYIYKEKLMEYRSDNTNNNPCENCPNNPKNGGSGICVCQYAVPDIWV